MRIIFLFIDGFGLGEEDGSKNPIYAADAPNIRHILKNQRVIPTDTTMDIPGLPQSATGQTAIFTGVNAAQALGRHLSGQPTITLKKIIYENNLFMELLRRGLKVTNSNVYRQEYLEKMQNPQERKYRPSTTSVMTLASGLRFRTVEDYKKGTGVYHDITGQIIKESGYDAEIITPEEAARNLYCISREHDFTLYEHFMTDIIGHKADMAGAIAQIELLDRFVGELLKLVSLDEDIVFITSDHGNIEDVSVRTHTYNKVPTIVLGSVPAGADIRVQTLMDIMPAVLSIFDADTQ